MAQTALVDAGARANPAEQRGLSWSDRSPVRDAPPMAARYPLVAIAATTAAPITATAAATAAALVLRLVHTQAPAAHVGSVESANRIGRGARVFHLHEREAPRSPRLAIHDHVHGCDRPVRLKERTEVALGGAERKVPYVQFLTQLSFLFAALRLERGVAVALLCVGLSDLIQLVPITAHSESTIGSGELSCRPRCIPQSAGERNLEQADREYRASNHARTTLTDRL